MDNSSYIPDPNEDSAPEPQVSSVEQNGYLSDIEKIRKTIDPNVFCAPLNQGELSTSDKFSLAFLIIFPSFFFALGVLLTAVLS